MRNALFHHLPTYQARYEQEQRKSNAMRNIVLLILIFVLNACATCKKQTQAQIDAEYKATPRVITLTPVTIEYFDDCTFIGDRGCTLPNGNLGPSQSIWNAGTTGMEGSIRCEEDQPCWDCKTMGNKICGNKGDK